MVMGFGTIPAETIEQRLAARAVVALVRVAFGAMALAEAIDRRTRARHPHMPSLVARLVKTWAREANAPGGLA